jgi:hypothetical protein
MAQTAKNPENALMPSPKALERALIQSASRAQRMADAFGLKVPVAHPRPGRAKPQPVVS